MNHPCSTFHLHTRAMKAVWLCLPIVIVSIATASCAASPETWKTEIACGGQGFTVESHCRKSGKPFEANECVADQSLSNGSHLVRVPEAAPSKGAAPLFAVAWGCAQARGQHFLTLSYVSGQGRSDEDELAEAFSLELKSVADKALLVEIFRNEDKGAHGRIRSILPDGEVSK